MSDRMNDVLAAIDAELNKCVCGTPLRKDGASLDYCSQSCQYRHTVGLVGEAPDPGMYVEDNPGLPPRSFTSGPDDPALARRALEEQRQRHRGVLDRYFWGARPNTADARTAALEEVDASWAETLRFVWCPDVADPAAPTAGELAAGTELETIPSGEHPLTIGFDGVHTSVAAVDNEGQVWTTEQLQAMQDGINRFLENFHMVSTYGAFAVEARPRPISIAERIEAERRPLVREILRRADRIGDAWARTWEAVAAAPTASPAEQAALARALYDMGTRVPVTPARIIPDTRARTHIKRVYRHGFGALLGCACEDFSKDFGPGDADETIDAAFVEHVTAATGLTPAEYHRQRALAHQQNRGTGPAPKRQRRPRDHGPRRPR